jgi:hypothetical protein
MRELTPFTLAEYDTASFRFSASTVLRATPEAVFAELGDPSLWFAMLRRSVWRSGATGGLGALREVDVIGFGSFRERMIAWDEPRADGRGVVAFTMIATTSPLVDQMAEDMRLERAAGGTRFSWRVAATPSTLGRSIRPLLHVILRGLFVASMRGLARRTVWSAGRVAATQGA